MRTPAKSTRVSLISGLICLALVSLSPIVRAGGLVGGQNPGPTPIETMGSIWTRVFQLGGGPTPPVDDAPETVFLDQNVPNPFNPTTRIKYGVPAATRVRLTVYSLVGRPVATLVDAWRDAGTYVAEFSATDVPSGVYFYRLETGSNTVTRRLTVSR